MAQRPMQARVVARTTPDSSQNFLDISLFDSLGNPLTVGAKVATSADAGALTSAAAAGATPTKAEFDKVVVDLATIRTALNDLKAKMRTAGILA